MALLEEVFEWFEPVDVDVDVDVDVGAAGLYVVADK